MQLCMELIYRTLYKNVFHILTIFFCCIRESWVYKRNKCWGVQCLPQGPKFLLMLFFFLRFLYKFHYSAKRTTFLSNASGTCPATNLLVFTIIAFRYNYCLVPLSFCHCGYKNCLIFQSTKSMFIDTNSVYIFPYISPSKILVRANIIHDLISKFQKQNFTTKQLTNAIGQT